MITGQVLVWVMTRYIWEIEYPYSVLYLSGGYLILNILFFLVRGKNTDVYIFIHLLVDICELSAFFYLTGGASNPFTWFLLMPVIFSALVLKRIYTWLLVFLAIACYTLLIKFFQPVSMDMTMMHHGHQTSFSQHLIGMWLGFIVIVIVVSWIIIGLVKNIRNKDAQLMQANIRQAQSNQILALATLATGSAHELGTPLTTINIIIKEMLNNKELSAFHKQLQIVESQVYRCKESLTQITASTGTTQAVKGKKVLVSEFVDKVLHKIDSSENINVELSRKDRAESSYIISDKTLRQSVVNIINNSFEAQASNVRIVTGLSRGYLQVSVTDDGVGLNPEFGLPVESEKEFGMGLGLFLAQATINRFSGNIEVTENVPKGTQIVINIPLVQS